jgi:anti-anti-sigma regulatory factor
MFSIFRRRRDRTAAPPTAGAAEAFDRDGLLGPDSIVVEGTTTLSGLAEDPRELARQTTAKIDAIESEMIRDLAPARSVPSTPSSTAPAAAARAVLPARVQAPVRGTRPSVSLETVLTGPALHTQPDLSDAPERASAPGPDRLEEAAVLYANGQFGQSETVLLAALDALPPGEPARSAWEMLLDLYRSTGRRAEFDAGAARYAEVFAAPAPIWDEAESSVDPEAVPASLPAWVSVPENLDAAARPAFEDVRRLAQQGRSVALDVRAVLRVAPVGADLMVRTLAAFARSRRELEVVGTDALLGVVARSCGVKAAVSSQMCWLLHLELLRLLGRRTQFEDVSIDYCARWEVPPPLWSPMPDSVRAAIPGELRMSGVTPSCAVAEGIESGVMEFRGRLEGRATEALTLLRARAVGCDQLVVDCRQLRRIDFSAAGELLNEVVALTSAGKYLRFRDVSPLVAALMAVLGITDLAEVSPRPL